MGRFAWSGRHSPENASPGLRVAIEIPIAARRAIQPIFGQSPATYFGATGALRKLPRSPMSVAFRVGHGTPNSLERSTIRGPCCQSAAVNETVVNGVAPDLSAGPLWVPSAIVPWQAAQP